MKRILFVMLALLCGLTYSPNAHSQSVEDAIFDKVPETVKLLNGKVVVQKVQGDGKVAALVKTVFEHLKQAVFRFILKDMFFFKESYKCLYRGSLLFASIEYRTAILSTHIIPLPVQGGRIMSCKEDL